MIFECSVDAFGPAEGEFVDTDEDPAIGAGLFPGFAAEIAFKAGVIGGQGYVILRIMRKKGECKGMSRLETAGFSFTQIKTGAEDMKSV